MVIFEFKIKMGLLEKKLGRETVSIDISEIDMSSLLKMSSHWNKTLNIRFRQFLEEARNEGFDMLVSGNPVVVTCPHCKEKVMV